MALRRVVKLEERKRGTREQASIVMRKGRVELVQLGSGGSCHTQWTLPRHSICQAKSMLPNKKQNDSRKAGFKFCRSLIEHRWKP